MQKIVDKLKYCIRKLLVSNQYKLLYILLGSLICEENNMNNKPIVCFTGHEFRILPSSYD